MENGVNNHKTVLEMGLTRGRLYDWLLAVGYWLLAIGYWLLAIGYWLLAIGCWLLAGGFSNPELTTQNP